MKFSKIEYKRPDIQLLIQKLDELIVEFKKADSHERQCEIYRQYYALIDKYETQYAIVRIRNFQNTNDEFYREEHLFFSQSSPLLIKRRNELIGLVLNSRFRDELTEYIGRLALINAELLLSTFSDDIIEDKREESRLVLQYIKTMSELSVDWDGEKVSLPALIAFKENKDREIRKNAFIAEGECYNTVKDQLDVIFDSLVKNRNTQAKKLGFNNYVGLGYAKMMRNCYNCEDIEVFRQQVKDEIVPVVKLVLEKRRKRLGVKSLHFYDMALSHGDKTPKPQIKTDQLLEVGKKMYSEMSPDTKEFIEMMIDNELFDLYPRLGKSAGGFCSFLSEYEYPLIFANCNGTAYDVNVLTHEAGHAFAHYMSGKAKERDYYGTSMDVSESCSMSMEFLTRPWHHLFFGADTERYHQKQLEDALILISYACQVDEFQQRIYETPELKPSQRDELWLEVEKQYRPGIDYDGLPFYSNGCGWQRQSHIYKSPFYYIDYALAQITGLYFYTVQLKDPNEAMRLYLNFLDGTRKFTYTELLESVGFQSPLKPESIKHLISTLSGLL